MSGATTSLKKYMKWPMHEERGEKKRDSRDMLKL